MLKKIKNNRGFTLIELLVVISIIGMLAAVVMISLNDARRDAQITKFNEEVRQVELAIQLYRDSVGGIEYYSNDHPAYGGDPYPIQDNVLGVYMPELPEVPFYDNLYLYIGYKNENGWVKSIDDGDSFHDLMILDGSGLFSYSDNEMEIFAENGWVKYNEG